jgi:hypothetical protein
MDTFAFFSIFNGSGMGFKFSRSSVAKIIGDLSRSVSLLNEYP